MERERSIAPDTDQQPDIARSMRLAFSTTRIAAAWDMVALADGADRLAALNGFERLLQSRGLTLKDVHTAILDPSAARDDQGRESDSNANDAAVGLAHLHASDVPERVSGTVGIVERRAERRGETLLFTISDDRFVMGPIVAHAGPQIEHLAECARSGRRVDLLLERSDDDRILPKLRRVEADRKEP